MNRIDPLYHIWLSFRLGVASREFLTLYESFDDVFEIYRAEEDLLSTVKGISEGTVAALCDKNLDPARKCMYTCARYNINICVFGDENYPRSLMRICDPPVVLYYVGEIPDFDERLSLSIVGTRKMSEYGKQTAYKISYELAAADIMIVSGMALGIDGVASCGAIEGGGKCVAVLGSGIDVVYPKEHSKLMSFIMRQGAVISEYPPGTPPDAHNFPVRNRIISGLSDGTFVIEGDAKSGSLITARHAVEQGKPIFAVPGSLEERNSEGTNLLLRSGANIVLGSDDIITFFKGYYDGAPLPINEILFKKAHLVKTDCDVALDRMKICARIYGRNYNYGKELDSTERLRKEQENSLLATKTARSEKNLNSTTQESAKRARLASLQEKINATAKSASRGSQKAEDIPAVKADRSSEIYGSLNEKHKAIFDAVPIGEYITADELVKATGYSVPEILTAVTMLELKGLLDIHPGGQYGRR